MSDEHHDMHCPGCGSHYTLTDDTLQWAVRLADYARVTENDGINAARLQWAQDAGAATADAYFKLVGEQDRKTIKRFLCGREDRRTRQAWRAVAMSAGVPAPFDIVSPENG